MSREHRSTIHIKSWPPTILIMEKCAKKTFSTIKGTSSKPTKIWVHIHDISDGILLDNRFHLLPVFIVIKSMIRELTAIVKICPVSIVKICYQNLHGQIMCFGKRQKSTNLWFRKVILYKPVFFKIIGCIL